MRFLLELAYILKPEVTMRLFRYCLLLILVLPVLAKAAGQPDNLQPLPDAPPPPPGVTDANEEPEITIIKKGENTVEEYRIHGELYMQKITPAHGVPYYLMKEDQEGGWSRSDGPTAPLAVPKWILFRF
jgi:hypothetical protein